MQTRRTASSAAFLLSSALLGCGPEPLFPEGYAASYVETYPCSRSADHALSFVRILVSPEAADTFRTATGTFAPGAVVLKEEYADEACTELEGWSVMRREPAGTAADGLGWAWQGLDAEKREKPGGVASCIACHRACDAFEGTCLERP